MSYVIYYNNMNIPLVIINLDQEKTFDGVNHVYSFQVLWDYRFDDIPRPNLKIMYIDVDLYDPIF